MKRLKTNLKKMSNFHTFILVVLLVVVVVITHTNTAEGKLQTVHKHHNHNYKHHNDGGSNKNDNHHHHHHSHHSQYPHPHYQHQQQTITPTLEFTTSSSSTMNSDKAFFLKQHPVQHLLNEDVEVPLVNEDDIYFKTKNLKSSPSTSSSTTSKPSSSTLQLLNKSDHVIKTFALNSTTTEFETLSNSIMEHTHHNHYSRIIPTPLPSSQSHLSAEHDDSTGNRRHNTAIKYWDTFEKSNLSLAKENQLTKHHEQHQHQHQKHHQHHQQQLQSKQHHSIKPEYEDEQQQQQNYDDYYDDDYNEDDGDNDKNDGISYDDDNNLSDRSYARITRSKLDDDYADDEPYRNGISDHEMQHDAAPGVLTEQKYLEVGNEKAVQQARERFIQEQKRPRTPHELATEHWHRMIQATKCRKPLPRVIPISNNTSKRYEPYATILHRCGDDTGCCGSTASVCTVKRHEIVTVYVFSYDFNYRKEIEALPMQNHTECHCVNRGSLMHDYMPRDKRSGGNGHPQHLQRQRRRQQLQKDPNYQSQSLWTHSQLQLHHQQYSQPMLDCHCPRHFNVFEEDVERHVHLPRPHSVFTRKCRCDCLVNNQTCLRFKNGEEGFSLEDRKCILEDTCRAPVCSYGDYNIRIGRCPSYRSHLKIN